MTITIEALQFFMYVNAANMPLGDVNVEFTSQYSKQPIISQLATVTETNDRYSTVSVLLSEDLTQKRYNGIYEFRVYSGSTVYASGIAKLIFPDGEPDVREYISNNEQGVGTVYFTPEN